MPLQIEIFKCLADNYGFLLHDSKSGRTAAIDAPEADPINKALVRRNWKLSDVLITHHHWDHTGAIAALKLSHDITVSGSALEADKIDGLDKKLSDGDRVMIGNTGLRVIATPGHTLGHVCYFDTNGKNLFTGDAMFSLGCGRMFEGTPAMMWAGLERLRELPDETMVYCGHEYGAANAAFALSIDPNNKALQTRAAEISALRSKNLPEVPFLLGEDKRANPFLRADDPELASLIGMSGAAPTEVFGAIRKAKDVF
ncbi:Hydroxyacylglutathione hydrolase [hydrothermal vent metagenome]|uniref:hydroxyacylglutathione hydrolase n=1 Tax=hydrothermal vent metagenome TaxID=652676 RepID=A0A3B0TQ43_9ZZZZ